MRVIVQRGEKMQILNVATQPAKLEVATQNTVLQLTTTAPQVELSTAAAKLEIHQAQGAMSIDQSPCRASYGFKSPLEFARDIANEGMRDCAEGIGRRAQQGDRLASIETHENAVVNMAAESGMDKTSEITWAHIDSPDVSYNMTPADIQFSPGELNVNLKRGTVENNSQRGSVDVRVAQYASIRMWTTENKVDLSL